MLNAAKRVSKKRTNSDLSTTSTVPPSPAKKARSASYQVTPLDPASYEASLALPESEAGEEELRDVVVHTNRAPLVVAFAVTVLKYTMPEQPLSSRLSLAQAMCNANSQSKAKSLGIRKGQTAEEEGWGEGQPLATVLNRKIQVMKRWGYSWKEDEDNVQDWVIEEEEEKEGEEEKDTASSQGTIRADDNNTQDTSIPEEPALWGVDLDQLKKASTPVTSESQRGAANSLPIYRPESARAYLLKSFASKPDASASPAKGKKKNLTEEKERNLGMLLRALDLLCQSWHGILDNEDLDRRAWGWYCSVRPDVRSGVAGWGGKGNVALADILGLRRPP